MINNFQIDKKSTLFVISFGMGMWVAGSLTYKVMTNLAARYDLSVVCPGVNKEETLRIIERLYKNFDQVIIAGYPPFIKDVIDDAEASGIKLKKYNIKFLFAAESFSEEWREYMHNKVGSSNLYLDSLDIYGTADALMMGHETPLSILVRRAVFRNKELQGAVFANQLRIPSLVQYNPVLRYFEELPEQKLIFTANSGVPLIRYDIGDNGSVISFDNMMKILSFHKVDIRNEVKKAGIEEKIWKLPFLTIFGRTDFTGLLYGINIYPELIKSALELDHVSKYTTGKFTMITRHDDKYDHYLEVNIELKNGVKPEINLQKMLQKAVSNTLIEKSTEFSHLYKDLGDKAEPRILLYNYGDPKYFKSGIKQRWTKKD